MKNILFLIVLLSFLTVGLGILAQDSKLPELMGTGTISNP